MRGPYTQYYSKVYQLTEFPHETDKRIEQKRLTEGENTEEKRKIKGKFGRIKKK